MSWKTETCGTCEFFIENEQLSDRGECRLDLLNLCWENKKWQFYWQFTIKKCPACGHWRERGEE